MGIRLEMNSWMPIYVEADICLRRKEISEITEMLVKVGMTPHVHTNLSVLSDFPKALGQNIPILHDVHDFGNR